MLTERGLPESIAEAAADAYVGTYNDPVPNSS